MTNNNEALKQHKKIYMEAHPKHKLTYKSYTSMFSVDY